MMGWWLVCLSLRLSSCAGVVVCACVCLYEHKERGTETNELIGTVFETCMSKMRDGGVKFRVLRVVQGK